MRSECFCREIQVVEQKLSLGVFEGMEVTEQHPEQELAPACGDSPKAPAELIAEGKRCLASGDANGAVESLQEACAQLAQVHGQVAQELAEPYYLYGRALLEVARQETSVLGSGIPVPDEKASSDEESEEKEPMEADSEGSPEKNQAEPIRQEAASTSNKQPAQSAEPSEQAASTNNKQPAQSAEPSGQSTDAPGPSSSSMAPSDAPGPSGEASDVPGPSTSVSGQGEEEEEETDLKLAWEVLELARVICQKQEGGEFRMKLADVSLALGEVGMESDQYEQAIGDLETCLRLREEALEPTDRQLAEVHFNLGLAYTLAKCVDNSIQEYKKAKEVLQKRKEKLQADVEGKGEGERKGAEDEVKELEGLLPDLNSKIADAEEMKRMMEERAKEEGESSTSTGFGESSSSSDAKLNLIEVKKAPVTDISHLVRKRPAEDAPDESRRAKRPCTEEGKEPIAGGKTVNGESTAEALSTSVSPET